MQPPLWQSRDLVGGGLGPVVTSLQTCSTVAITSKLSSVPKLHVDRCSSETLRPPPLIHWAPNRLQAATSVAKQTPCWWRSWTGGHEPPNCLHRCNNIKVIKFTKVACRQVQLRNAETSTTDLLGYKRDPHSHLCCKADTLLVEVLDRRLRASKVAPPLEYVLLSSVPKLHVDRFSSETLRPPPLIYWATRGIHTATSVAKQTPCWWRSWTGGHEPPNLLPVAITSKLSSVPKLHVDWSSSETLRPPPLIYWATRGIHTDTSVAKQIPCWWRFWTGGYGPPNWLHRWNMFCYQAYQSCM